jgi:hypothetical protein
VSTPPVAPTPTQVRHPWRATVRTAIAAITSAALLVPLVAHELGGESVPWVAAIIGVAAAITRVMAIPAVNEWLTRWLDLGATPRQ